MSAPRIIPGPPVTKVSKKEAEDKLVAHPEFPKGASYTLEEVEGRWIAAISADITKESAPPFPPEDPAGPPVDGPPIDKPEPDDAPEDDKPKEDKPEGDKKEKGGEIGELTHLIKDVLLPALGLSADGPESPIPGLDEGPPPPPPSDGAGPDGKSHTVHERALKPGEAPPGTTPIGSPSFASTNPDHPWKDIVDVKRSFVVEEPIGNAKLAEVREQLERVAAGTGYGIKQLREVESNGQRVAQALISK